MRGCQKSTKLHFAGNKTIALQTKKKVKHKIKLRPEEVKDFVSAATKCIFDVDISYNRFVVDAKSILGVLGLNFNQVLTVSVNGYDEEFEQYLKKFAVAC